MPLFVSIRQMLTTAGLLAVVSTVEAQTTVSQATRDAFNQVHLTIPNYDLSAMYTIAGPEGRVIGSPYLDSSFAKTTVTFYRDMAKPGSKPLTEIIDAPVRYNLAGNELEFRIDPKTVKAISGEQVRQMKTERNGRPVVYVNAREFGPSAEPKALLEQLADGRLKLLVHHKIFVKKPTYNVAMSVGSKDTELIQETQYYVSDGKNLTRLSPSRKGLLALMKERETEMEAWLKAKKPDYKNPEDLAGVFQYYNGL
ncbi:hypothetical protein [Larkinella soli]|uniref:hypothetical protein n=1 Tax=Larkinella soli TaxID=1770527 RepID=UPI000FFB228F|nr:hypothetical protein [Larkinella soli]